MNVQHLYTQRGKLYDRLFCKILRYTRGLHAFFSTHNITHSSMRILDAGCGTGALIQALYYTAHAQKLTNITFHGFDLTPAMLTHFSHWINNNPLYPISIKKTNILFLETLPKNWNHYDLIVTSGMLEYLNPSEIVSALKQLKERLIPNGTIIIFISKDTLFNKLFIQKWWHAHLYKKDIIEKIIAKAGFTNITYFSFPASYFYLNLWGWCIQIQK